VERGACPLSELTAIEKAACPGHGACGGQYTANTMACVGEAIGLSLPNSNMAPAPYKSREDIARAAGRQVMELVERQLRPRDICTRAAFENAARVVAATGGSTNGALHLPAMAHECGIDSTCSTSPRYSINTLYRRPQARRESTSRRTCTRPAGSTWR
jgi:dihydroxy-acid dehydratase